VSDVGRSLGSGSLTLAVRKRQGIPV
jgi:hypothetical protein